MTYRGTIAFDPPHRQVRCDGGTGRWASGNCLEWKRKWREKHREHVREYIKNYMRAYRARKRT